MECFSDEELNNINAAAKKYFKHEEFRKLLVIKNDYIIVEHVTNIFNREGILLPVKYDDLIHGAIVDIMTDFVNSREQRDNFHKIFLVSMRKYDFAVVLFMKKNIPNLDYEVYNLSYNFLLFFINFNDELEENEKLEGKIIAGVEPRHFSLDF